MAESILAGTIHRQIEFVNGLTGACGPNALAMGLAWADQAVNVATYNIYTDMYQRGLCAASGASTLDALHQEAQNIGLPLTAYRGYGEPWTADGVSGWRAFYLLHAGHSFILMETANGQALKDAISGLGENATNLHYHFIGVVGHHDGGWSARAAASLPAGWWAVDGDNFASGDVLQFYPDDVMAAAQPCGAVTFGAKVSMQMAGVPTEWKDANGILTAPNGKNVQHGFRTHILTAPFWHPALMPVGDEYGTPAGPRQDFALSLVWINSATSETAAPDFAAQIAALENQPHAAPLTPYQQAAIAAAEADMAHASALATASALRGK